MESVHYFFADKFQFGEEKSYPLYILDMNYVWLKLRLLCMQEDPVPRTMDMLICQDHLDEMPNWIGRIKLRT